MPSRNDPNPEERKEDASFLPVVIIAAVVIVVILIAAVLLIKARQSKIIPAKPSTPTSHVLPHHPGTFA